MDPFVVLGLDRSFDLDLAAVEKRHRELSRALHPDKYAGAGASERRAALARAVEVNEAWRILRDPIRRAEAMLSSTGEGTSAPEPALPPEFLVDMLERREALSEAKLSRDLAAVRRLAASVQEQVARVEHELSAGFASGRTETLRARVGELRFYRRFLDEVVAIEDELAA